MLNYLSTRNVKVGESRRRHDGRILPISISTVAVVIFISCKQVSLQKLDITKMFPFSNCGHFSITISLREQLSESKRPYAIIRRTFYRQLVIAPFTYKLTSTRYYKVNTLMTSELHSYYPLKPEFFVKNIPKHDSPCFARSSFLVANFFSKKQLTDNSLE
jgi:hypothetical protein